MATILAFDVTNFKSFESTKAWIAEVLQEVSSGHMIFLVGLKADLEVMCYFFRFLTITTDSGFYNSIK